MNDKRTIFSSFVWKFSERLLSQGIGLVIQIMIARMIKPEAVGEMAILLSVINIFSVIAQSGFSSYIIQKKNLTDEIISTVIIFSILVALGCIVLFWIAGDFLMGFLGYPQLGGYLKIAGAMILFNAINGVLMGLLSKKMQFKEMFMRTLIVLPLSAIICFGLMLYGMDLEALIAYNIVNPFFTTIFLTQLLRKSEYKIRLQININELKSALPYSLRVLTQDIGNVACNSIRSFIMGGLYSSSDLAYYDRAFTYTSYVEESVTYTASSVLLPALAKEQDNKVKFNNYIVKSTALYSLVIIPALLGFAAVSPTFTKVILTEKWLNCVPYMCVFAIGFLHYPILTIQRPAFLACGRSDVTLKITILQNIVAILAIVATLKFSPLAIAIGTSISLLTYIPFYTYATRKHLGISYLLQIGPMIKYLLISIIMVVCIAPINTVSMNDALKLILQIVLGASVYVCGLSLTKDQYFFGILNIIKERIRRTE
ncbi:putative uncharacterized protein [Roseburia sp. CAG:471]|nr:putative uncharacterized protein [Roseburia sp. CAG:471]